MVYSFIIVEYHSMNDVQKCVQSIVNAVGDITSYEIIISSNSLYDEHEKNSIAELDYGNVVRWMFNNRNGGFAYAMNCGLKVARGNYIIFMNPDVRIKYGFFEMATYLKEHSGIGIIAPQIKNSRGEIQDSFRSFITPVNFVSRHFRRLFIHRMDVKSVNTPIVVDWIIGAFVMMSRQVAWNINGFDEEYFLYCEDMDLCKRINKKGLKVVYYPHACIEYEGTRSARHSWKYARVFCNSLFRYWRKFGL